MNFGKLRDEFALERTRYFLESLNVAVGKGRSTLNRDYPVPYEEALRNALVAAFDDTYMPALDYLIDSGQLDEIILASYNTSTGDFSPSILTSAFRTYFGPTWASRIQVDVQDAVEEMWDLGEEHINETVDADPDLLVGDKEDVVSQLVMVGVVAGTLGAVDRVIYPTAASTARNAFNHSRTVSELQGLLQTALRVDAPGRANVYYDMLSTTLVNRARNISRVSRSRALGYTEVIWITAGDEKVCPRCGALDGMTFSVDNLSTIIDDFISATTMDDIVNSMPWPGESDGDFVLPDGNTLAMDSAEEILAAHGIGIPPLHPRCRCDLDVVQHNG